VGPTDVSGKVMGRVLAQADMVETIREAIINATQTGQVGDGLVWVIDIENIHRIRDRQNLGCLQCAASTTLATSGWWRLRRVKIA